MMRRCNRPDLRIVTLALILGAWYVPGPAAWSDQKPERRQPAVDEPARSIQPGRLQLRVLDAETNDPIPCRIHLTDKKGKPLRPPGLPYFRGHFVCPGQASLDLTGTYHHEIERGPEWSEASGTISVQAMQTQELEIKLKRIADLAAAGWYAGDLHVHRPLEEIELLMRAEDLHVAPVITWWNNRNLWSDRPAPAELRVRFDDTRVYHVMAGEDEREGGALLYFGLSKPLPIAGSRREYPSPMQYLEQARRQPGVWVDIEKPFWWDVPVWLACGQIDSIGLANNHMCRSQMYESEAWGRPRDAQRLPPPQGNGFWTQEIYYQIQNAGLRVPPSAGSASGVLPNPVGYNRVYVHVGKPFQEHAWWDGLRQGRSFVTNGPLLLATASGRLPGHVFVAEEGEKLHLELRTQLVARDKIERVEVVKNGRIERTLVGTDFTNLGLLDFERSGWFLIRALAANDKTFRFASTAPFYVEIGATRQRISRSSVQFFIDWLKERRGRIKLADRSERESVLKYHDRALEFWQRRLETANAE